MSQNLTLEQELLFNFNYGYYQKVKEEGKDFTDIVIDEDKFNEDDIIKKPSRVFLERHKTFTSPKTKAIVKAKCDEKDELPVNNFELIPSKTKKIQKSISYEAPHITLQISEVKHKKKKEQQKSHDLRENVHVLTNTVNPPQSIQGITSKKSRKKGIKRDRDNKCFLATC